MHAYPLHGARAEFSKLVERAMNGEPQQVTRYSKGALARLGSLGSAPPHVPA
jgi:prevent-host-death family protein